MIYLLTAIGLSPVGSSTVHIYTHTIHRMVQNLQYIEQRKSLEECGLCPVLASYTLAIALQLRKKHGIISVRGSYRMKKLSGLLQGMDTGTSTVSTHKVKQYCKHARNSPFQHKR